MSLVPTGEHDNLDADLASAMEESSMDFSPGWDASPVHPTMAPIAHGPTGFGPPPVPIAGGDGNAVTAPPLVPIAGGDGNAVTVVGGNHATIPPIPICNATGDYATATGRLGPLQQGGCGGPRGLSGVQACTTQTSPSWEEGASLQQYNNNVDNPMHLLRRENF